MARVLILLLAIGLLAATFAEASKKVEKKVNNNQDEVEESDAPQDQASEESQSEKAETQTETTKADAEEPKEQSDAPGEQQEQKAEAPAADAEQENKDDSDDAEQQGDQQQDQTAKAFPEDDEASNDVSPSDAKSPKADEQPKEVKETKDAKKGFKCNLKFNRVGCFKDEHKKQRPLSNFIMKDVKLGAIQKKSSTSRSNVFDSTLPEFACRCANQAIERGGAIFGLQNLADCWSGNDDSKYDKDGKSDECVSFGLEKCKDDDALCVGHKASNFVYFIDVPEHTKSEDEAKKEWEQIKKADAEKKRKQQEAQAKKAKKGKKKYSKKVKSEKRAKKHGKKHA